MLYITSSPFSLVAYHAKQQSTSSVEVFKNVDALDVNSLLSKGVIFKPVTVVAQLKSDKPPKDLSQSQFNTAYVCVKDISPWRDLIGEKEWIKEIAVYPELYKGNLDKIAGIFAEDARDSLWSRFKYYPQKLQMELVKFLLQYGLSSRKITAEDIELLSIGTGAADYYPRYVRALGSPASTQLLKQIPSSGIWSLFIGSDAKPPYIYHYLVGKNNNGRCPELYQYIAYTQQVVKAGLMESKLAFILLNEWINQVGLKKEGNSLTFKPGIEEIQNLEQLIG